MIRFTGERVMPGNEYSVSKTNNKIVIKRSSIENIIPSNMQLIFIGPIEDKLDTQIIKEVKKLEAIAYALSEKSSNITYNSAWDKFISGGEDTSLYTPDKAFPYERRRVEAFEFIIEHFENIPSITDYVMPEATPV